MPLVPGVALTLTKTISAGQGKVEKCHGIAMPLLAKLIRNEFEEFQR